MNLNSNPKTLCAPPATWARISRVSGGVAALSVAFSFYVSLPPLGVLSALLLFGALAGAITGRHGWFSGAVIGLPFGLSQLAVRAWRESPAPAALLAGPDTWFVLLPTALVATGVAVLGGITGAWLRGSGSRP